MEVTFIPAAELAKKESPPKESIPKILFTRRPDITDGIRLKIGAELADIYRKWGTVTKFARKYGISRTFIYQLGKKFNDLSALVFGSQSEENKDPAPPIEETIKAILSFRMEGKSSIAAISTMLKRFGYKFTSVGFISQVLNRIGAALPATVNLEDEVQYLVVLSDEIFSKSVPILISVDPISSAILRIELAEDRKAETWKNHFECIFDNGVVMTYLVSDDGAGIVAGHKAASDTVRQSDTYHAIAHVLGKFVQVLEKAAYKAIHNESECQRKFNSAKSEDVLIKRLKAYEEAVEACELSVDTCDTFTYFYQYIVSLLNVFDSSGELRIKEVVEREITLALELLKELKIENITNGVNKVMRTLPNLFHYFDVAKTCFEECKKLGLPDDVLKAYCAAWQQSKNAMNSKKSRRKKAALEQEQRCLKTGNSWADEDGHEDESIQKKIYGILDGIVQSSALVECINSIVRPYFNASKNKISQEFLKLIMYFHNHRRYSDGKRKGSTPMELLTGKIQEKDWIHNIFELIRGKDPKLLLSS